MADPFGVGTELLGEGLEVMSRYEIGCLPSPSVDAATLLQGEGGAFLIFFAITPTGKDLGVAVLRCVGCFATKLGSPNDEGLREHELWDKGLGDLDYPVAEVAESIWTEQARDKAPRTRKRIWGEQEAVAFPHPLRASRHFLIAFKEQTFECLASDLEVVGFHATFGQAFDYVRSCLVQ
jgi:hypothetical protein